MTYRNTAGSLALGTLALALAGCAADRPAALASGTFHGEAVALGDGSARAYVTLENGEPVEFGVAISEAALSGLPGPPHHGPPGYEHVLRLPAEAAVLPFDHATVDWAPIGHEPPGIYDVPHFDIHFYMIDEQRRRAIDPANPDYEVMAAREPPPEYVPAGFIMPMPEAVPMMGTHWIAADAPELRGEPFSATFIYGSWDGEMVFLEPMVAISFLETRPDFSAPIGVAERHAWSGYHPTSYSVRYHADAGEFRISIGGFVRHD